MYAVVVSAANATRSLRSTCSAVLAVLVVWPPPPHRSPTVALRPPWDRPRHLMNLGFFGIAFSNSFKCFHGQNDNSAAFNANPVVLIPKTQLAVSSFPCHANKIAEILLGDGNSSLVCGLITKGQAQQGLGKPAGKGKKHETLGLLSGLSQPRAQEFDEFECNLRLFFHPRQKVPPLDHEHLTIGDRDGIRRARATVEQGDFAENITVGQQVEHGVVTVDRPRSYFHSSLADHEQTRARIIFCKNDGAPRDRLFGNAGHQTIDLLRIELAKKIMTLKQAALFGFTWAERSLVHNAPPLVRRKVPSVARGLCVTPA